MASRGLPKKNFLEEHFQYLKSTSQKTRMNVGALIEFEILFVQDLHIKMKIFRLT